MRGVAIEIAVDLFAEETLNGHLEELLRVLFIRYAILPLRYMDDQKGLPRPYICGESGLGGSELLMGSL